MLKHWREHIWGRMLLYRGFWSANVDIDWSKQREKLFQKWKVQCSYGEWQSWSTDPQSAGCFVGPKWKGIFPVSTMKFLIIWIWSDRFFWWVHCNPKNTNFLHLVSVGNDAKNRATGAFSRHYFCSENSKKMFYRWSKIYSWIYSGRLGALAFRIAPADHLDLRNRFFRTFLVIN